MTRAEVVSALDFCALLSKRCTLRLVWFANLSASLGMRTRPSIGLRAASLSTPSKKSKAANFCSGLYAQASQAAGGLFFSSL